MADAKTSPGADSARVVMPTRLTRQHFALYRGYLDGVSEARLHASYGDTSTDVRSTRRLIVVLRDTLSVLARRMHDTDAARLLRLKPGSIPPADSLAAAAPTVEAFRERVDPAGVFNEAELLALFEDEYPASGTSPVDRRSARNARLRRRQADALARMEATLAQDPHPRHAVDGWFEAAVAARLAAAGLRTIGDVIALVEAKRHRWYAHVPRLGPKGAQRVVDWLRLHAQALSHTVSPLATIPRRQWSDGMTDRDLAISDVVSIAPLEALRVPAALDGSKGTNRVAARVSLSFDTDIAAMNAWLDARSASEHTRRAYRRESERLLLWALVEMQKPLSSLDSSDCALYIESFLVDPKPAARWIAPGRAERRLAAWRPFAGPLSDRSRETARSILTAMCEWFVQTGYLASNPFSGMNRVASPPVFESDGRALDHDSWAFVLQSTARETYSFAEHRDRLALLLAYATGLRRGELAAATTGALSVGRLAGVADSVWRLDVPQVSRGSRKVLLASAVMESIQVNLTMRGLPDALACHGTTPILAQTRGGLAVSPDGIGRMIKRVLTRAASLLDEHQPGSGKRLREASTHWLRHTHSMHALTQGAHLHEIGAGLGHASLRTTATYVRRDDSEGLLGVETLIRASAKPR
jgi:integrase